MAKQKTVNVSVQYKELDTIKDELLVVGVFETDTMPRDLSALDKKTGGNIKRVYDLKDFSGKAKESVLIYNADAKSASRVLLAGLGKRDDFELDTIRAAAASAIRKADNIKAASVAICMDVPKGTCPEAKAQVIAEGLVFGRYQYTEQLSSPSGKDGILKASIIAWNKNDLTAMRKGAKVGILQAEGQNYSRSLANKSGGEINPVTLAAEARKLARKFGMKCKIFDDKELVKQGMGGILAVGQGSVSKPRLIMLEYNGKKATKTPDLVLVGKAVTFDSGGLCIKPGAGMHDMKFDKSGGCNVLGIMQAVASLKLAKNVVALVPAAENMPDGNSYRPGDIIKTYSGKTVEIQNTDAEGRMILCDALSYAVKNLKPKAIVDMATLTGACIIALGTHKAGLFANNDDIVTALKTASAAAGEPVWHLPCDKPYRDQLKSECADMRNIGGRDGGSATAAAFLREFVGEDVPWAHIDIAGVSDIKTSNDTMAAGGTGFIVRTIVEYLKNC